MGESVELGTEVSSIVSAVEWCIDCGESSSEEGYTVRILELHVLKYLINIKQFGVDMIKLVSYNMGIRNTLQIKTNTQRHVHHIIIIMQRIWVNIYKNKQYKLLHTCSIIVPFGFN